MHIKLRLKRALKRLCRIRNYTAATNQTHIDLTQFEFNMLKSIHNRDEFEELGDLSSSLMECSTEQYIMRLLPVISIKTFIDEDQLEELHLRSARWKVQMRD